MEGVTVSHNFDSVMFSHWDQESKCYGWYEERVSHLHPNLSSTLAFLMMPWLMCGNVSVYFQIFRAFCLPTALLHMSPYWVGLNLKMKTLNWNQTVIFEMKVNVCAQGLHESDWLWPMVRSTNHLETALISRVLNGSLERRDQNTSLDCSSYGGLKLGLQSYEQLLLDNKWAPAGNCSTLPPTATRILGFAIEKNFRMSQ